MPWALLILAFLLVVAPVAAEAATRVHRPDYWPTNWPSPPAEFLTAVAGAATDFSVPAADLVALAFVESRFKPRPTHRVLTSKWRKVWSKEKLGKSGKTWGDYYRENEWHAYGIMGLMPFNFVGVSGGISIGAPLRRGNGITLNVRMAARLLKRRYGQTGDWVSAIRAYNPGGGEAYYESYREAKATFEHARGAV